MAPDGERRQVLQALAVAMATRDDGRGCGLSLRGGRADPGRALRCAAYMLERTDMPSYGYQLAQGATSLTEAWDANPASSQDHFMLGDAEEWFYRDWAESA